MLEILLQSIGYIVLAYLLFDVGTGFTKYILEISGAGKRERELAQRNRAKQVSELDNLPSPASPEQADFSANSEETSYPENKSGRYIGLLERLLIVAGLVWNNWEIILAVIALKTVARHKELDDKIDAEYFLIGSFASIVWAIGVAVLLVLYDRHFGFSVLPTTWLFGT
jgi:NADH:ubiquinone oxidoreductase subunit K